LPASNIVMLAGDHPSTAMVYNALRQHFRIQRVIIERAPSRRQLLLRRIKRLGMATVIGQILFKLVIVPYLDVQSKRRIKEIKKEFLLQDMKLDEAIITRVDSVNSEQTAVVLRKLNPDIVIVNGTRIIAEPILSCIRVPFVNMHTGITPLYRGVHGAYWALVEGKTTACGVTIHLVDLGIDTGKILRQAVITPTAQDNFVTYPLLQLSVGIPLLISSVADLLEGHMDGVAGQPGQSRLWSHPTAFEYLYNRIARGVK
jgi:methionyl-tRNA formyltransferase